MGAIRIEQETGGEVAYGAAVPVILGRRIGDARDRPPLTLVGPASEGHGSTIVEQLRVRGGDRSAKTAGVESSVVAEVSQICDADAGAGYGAQAI